MAPAEVLEGKAQAVYQPGEGEQYRCDHPHDHVTAEDRRHRLHQADIRAHHEQGTEPGGNGIPVVKGPAYARQGPGAARDYGQEQHQIDEPVHT